MVTLCKTCLRLTGWILKQQVKSRISYSTDTWTTKQMVHSFACTVAFFIDDNWNLTERVIDFQPLDGKDHEGFYAAKAFIEGAHARGGLNKISLKIMMSDLVTYQPILYEYLYGQCCL